MKRSVALFSIILLSTALTLFLPRIHREPTIPAAEHVLSQKEGLTPDESDSQTISEEIIIEQKPEVLEIEISQTPVVSRETAVQPQVSTPAPSSHYPFDPRSFEDINTAARSAVVNIYCSTSGGSPVTATGVIIDARGIILTNAHVAQYMLLDSDPRINVDCSIRTGSPAVAAWEAEVMYLPPVWVSEHAKQLTEAQATGTGEHDWALLKITQNVDSSPFASHLPFLLPETRQEVIDRGQDILLASYPAGFIGGLSVTQNLSAVSTITTIKNLFTFDDGTIDLISLGGVIIAQSGSSGGAVVNQWNRLIAIIVTTSTGDSTAERDLRAVTLYHVDEDLRKFAGMSLVSLLGSDIQIFANDFKINIAPGLTKQLIDVLDN